MGPMGRGWRKPAINPMNQTRWVSRPVPSVTGGTVSEAQERGRPDGPGPRETTCKPPASDTVRGKNTPRWLVPMPRPSWPNTLPRARRIEPRRATRSQERELQGRRLDHRGDRRAQVAAFAGPRLREKGHRLMSKKPRQVTTSVTAGNRPAPARVKLRRISCNQARPYPPDGQAREWWQD